MGSVGQRAAKFLVVKIGVLKKYSVGSAITAEVCASVFGPGSNHSKSLMDSNFAAL